MLALSRRDLFDGSSAVPYALGAAAALVLVALVWLERRKEQPLLSPDFFRSRSVLATLSAKLLMGASLIIAMVTVPLMANTVLERSSLEGGLMLMRLTSTVPVGALLGGYLAYRLGHRAVSALGLAIAAAGLFLMSGWLPDDGDAMLTLYLLLAGFGFGLVIAPLFVAAMDAGPDDYQATAASMVTVARMVGMALGLAALSAWGMDRFLLLAAELPSALSPEYGDLLAEASITLFQDFFRVSAWLCVIGLAPVAAMGGGGRARGERVERGSAGRTNCRSELDKHNPSPEIPRAGRPQGIRDAAGHSPPRVHVACVATGALGIMTYRYLVRYTSLGTR